MRLVSPRPTNLSEYFSSKNILNAVQKCNGMRLICALITHPRCRLWWDVSTIRKKLLYVQLPCKPMLENTRTCQCVYHLPSSLNKADRRKWLPAYCSRSHWQDPPDERNLGDVGLVLAEGGNDTGVSHWGLPYSNGRCVLQLRSSAR